MNHNGRRNDCPCHRSGRAILGRGARRKRPIKYACFGPRGRRTLVERPVIPRERLSVAVVEPGLVLRFGRTVSGYAIAVRGSSENRLQGGAFREAVECRRTSRFRAGSLAIALFRRAAMLRAAVTHDLPREYGVVAVTVAFRRLRKVLKLLPCKSSEGLDDEFG